MLRKTVALMNYVQVSKLFYLIVTLNAQQLFFKFLFVSVYLYIHTQYLGII